MMILLSDQFLDYRIPAIGIETIVAKNEITPPTVAAANTVTTTARMLFHSTLVIRKVVARAARVASKMTVRL